MPRVPESYDEPGRMGALFLAVFMHGMLLLVLMMSVRWQTRHVPVTFQAEIWAAPAPESSPVRRVSEPPPPPPPIRPVPAPVPKAAPPSRVPDIKLKSSERDKKKSTRKSNKVKESPLAPAFEDLLAREETQLDRRKTEEGRMLRVEEEARLLAQARADQETQQRAAAYARAMADYQGKLKGKIRGNIVQPTGMKGNPVARFVVTQLPSGEILEVRLKRSSGNVAYDASVERAIWKSSPLPRPDDPSAFSRDLELIICPDEVNGCR